MYLGVCDGWCESLWFDILSVVGDVVVIVDCE